MAGGDINDVKTQILDQYGIQMFIIQVMVQIPDYFVRYSGHGPELLILDIFDQFSNGRAILINKQIKV